MGTEVQLYGLGDLIAELTRLREQLIPARLEPVVSNEPELVESCLECRYHDTMKDRHLCFVDPSWSSAWDHLAPEQIAHGCSRGRKK